MTKVRS